MNARKNIEKLKGIPTPYYFYDMELLRSTLKTVTDIASGYQYKVHYALKANFNERILAEVRSFGLGADCVSGGEVRAAIRAGIPASEVVFAGVAKSDEEIRYALVEGIHSFNCESREELEVINSIAASMSKRARIALRINPDVDPMTHKYISTGKSDNKFGISYKEVEEVMEEITSLSNLDIVGLHFHIGSQIRNLSVFKELCLRVNTLQEWFTTKGLKLSHINVGGGLGIDYDDPASEPIPDFRTYFSIFNENLALQSGQTLHFELGRSIVAQCGELITKVLYNKVTGSGINMVFVDAGMTDLIRPALYQAKHRIENITSTSAVQTYTVAGPICESSDIFARDIELPQTKRGDILTMLSAGAYGRAMSSNYNLREMTAEVYSDDL